METEFKEKRGRAQESSQTVARSENEKSEEKHRKG